jgi:phage baseplate assembly protein W
MATTAFKELVGSGWGFPVQLDARGEVALTNDDNEIHQAIYIILSTAKGERVMRPEFGCGIHDYIFAPSNNITAAAVEVEVREALERWEPRINVKTVKAIPSNASIGTMMIEIEYEVKSMNDQRSLVFPFYLLP